MKDIRKWGDQHILQSLKEIDENTWLIGSLLLQRLPPSSTRFATWKDDDGASFLLSAAPKPSPAATADIKSPHITLIHTAGDASGVWSIGNNAVCKARFTIPGITPESTTLQYVQERNPSFGTPEVIYHAYESDRNFLFLRRVPGPALFKMWPSLDDHGRQKYIDEVVGAIEEMGQWKGLLGGIDGQGVLENWVLGPRAKSDDYTPQELRANCEEIGMDCSDCVFIHADLAPTNILVDDNSESARLNLVDWELAGFFPKSWIRTKFNISWEFDVNEKTNADPELYRKMMDQALQRRGYDDFSEAFRKRKKQGKQSRISTLYQTPNQDTLTEF